ncbi:hypothetical protein P7K49_023404 [Saguinus oedipus]|uniref:Uncharacterized protein n=1 Tax=Saguinus oedipus TaxID=9490 RepID=A0ABQ9ULJ5_SAGOE|nr:hypothetical protein P7K49_023404 [Saguinus oedipus]
MWGYSGLRARDCPRFQAGPRSPRRGRTERPGSQLPAQPHRATQETTGPDSRAALERPASPPVPAGSRWPPTASREVQPRRLTNSRLQERPGILSRDLRGACRSYGKEDCGTQEKEEPRRSTEALLCLKKSSRELNNCAPFSGCVPDWTGSIMAPLIGLGSRLRPSRPE